MLRWLLDISEWSLSEFEFASFLGSRNLCSDDQSSILKFVHLDDRKRALASRLMQRACIAHVCGVEQEEVKISRTRGGKPFTSNVKPDSAPNFNFNVSHEVGSCL